MGVGWLPCTHSEQLDPAALSAQTARGVLGGICEAAAMPQSTVDTALLLISELVTNAVTHGRGRPSLAIDLSRDRLHVSVTDDAPETPTVQRDLPVLAEGGRGLLLVETLAARWGTDPHQPGGKVVWFELDRV